MTEPRMRAGNTDRQAAVDRLTRRFTESRLDAGEFDERVGKAYAATHLDKLPPLFADLPEDQPRRGSGPGAHAGRALIIPVHSDRPVDSGPQVGPILGRGRTDRIPVGHRGSSR